MKLFEMKEERKVICTIKDNCIFLPNSLNLPQQAVILFVGDTIKLYTLKAWESVCEKTHGIEDKNKRNMALRILFSTSHEVDIVDGKLNIPKRYANDGNGKVTVHTDFWLIKGIEWAEICNENEEEHDT